MSIAFAALVALVWIYGGVPNVLPVAAKSSNDVDWPRRELRGDLMREEIRVQVECSKSGANLDRCERVLDMLRAQIRATDR